jgi:aldose 1-epimerase
MLTGRINGKEVNLFTLQNGQVAVDITNYGVTITAVRAPDKNGICLNIVAGFGHLEEYAQNHPYFGCVLGRYANRIAGGKLLIDNQPFQLSLNEEFNHLHGGWEGFNKKIWTLSSVINNQEETGVVFEYESKNGEEGYPGDLKVEIKYLLTPKNELIIKYNAVTDKKTPVNLSNHSYFNLTGFEKPVIYDHILNIHADYYTEKNERNVPNGKILPVQGSPLNFTVPKRIGDDINNFPLDKGFDHNYVLNHFSGKVQLAAELLDPDSQRMVRIYTDQPGLQLYSANWWNGTITGQQGKLYVQHGAVALEMQAFPDSPNHPEFPGTILEPGQIYARTTIYEFAVAN